MGACSYLNSARVDSVVFWGFGVSGALEKMEGRRLCIPKKNESV